MTVLLDGVSIDGLSEPAVFPEVLKLSLYQAQRDPAAGLPGWAGMSLNEGNEVVSLWFDTRSAFDRWCEALCVVSVSTQPLDSPGHSRSTVTVGHGFLFGWWVALSYVEFGELS